MTHRPPLRVHDQSKLKLVSICSYRVLIVSAASNARIHIMLGGSDVGEAGPAADVRGPGTTSEGVETDAEQFDESRQPGGPGPARPLEPKPVFCELCELTRADSQPDDVPPSEEEHTWKEIARCARFYSFICFGFYCCEI